MCRQNQLIHSSIKQRMFMNTRYITTAVALFLRNSPFAQTTKEGENPCDGEPSRW
jgi:hypothetical protein